MRLGVYSDVGSLICGMKYLGSYGYEEFDVYIFVLWGIDYLKYDNCGGF